MKLYDGGRVPNARRVRIFLHEKGVQVPLVPVDLAKKEQASPAFLAMNPFARVPVLELDDGTILTESIAICRYFEETHPAPALFGEGALDRAMVEMWNRRVELELYLAVQAVFRHTHPGMAGHEVPQIAEWGNANVPRIQTMLALLDNTLAAREFIAGASFSVADITAMVAVDFLKPIRMGIAPSHGHLARWHQQVSARPSAAA